MSHYLTVCVDRLRFAMCCLIESAMAIAISLHNFTLSSMSSLIRYDIDNEQVLANIHNEEGFSISR